VIQHTQYLNAFSFAKRMTYVPWATCSNTSYLRAVLLSVNGFETNFPFNLGGDDSDLGIRLNKAGYRLKSNPQAEVNHSRATWNSFSAVWRRAFRWGRMDLHLYFRRHNNQVIFGFPKFSNILLALFAIAILQSIITLNPLNLIWPLIWAGVYLLAMAFYGVVIAKEKWSSIFHELVANILRLASEFGLIYEGIKCGEWSVLIKAVQRGPILPTTQQQFSFQPWAMWLAILMIMLIQLFISK